MKRKRLISILLSLLLFVSLNLTACSNNSTNQASGDSTNSPKYVLKLGHSYAMEDTLSQAAEMMSKEVFEKSNGEIKIEVYGGGQLGSTSDHTEGVANGFIDIGADAINTLDSVVPLADIESYPFLFDSVDKVVAFLNDDLSKQLWEEVGGDTFKIVGASYRGARMLQTTKPVYQMSDLKGLKLRTASMPILHKPWEILGAATTPMSYNEIYTGLQQGTIEGQENPLGASFTSGFVEVEEYVMNTRHVYGIQAFFFNKSKFEQLPEDCQKIIIEACENAANWRTKKEVENEEDYIKKFKEKGVEFIDVKDLDDWVKTIEGPIKEGFPHLQDWVRKIKEFNLKL